MSSAFFRNELELIKLYTMRNDVAMLLDHFVPTYFFRISASSTGKRHPQYACGEGGLLRHTRAAVAVGNALLEAAQIVQLKKDAAIAALILHDAWKQGTEECGYTRHEHPVFAAERIKESGISWAIPICNLIASHMGRWTTDKTGKSSVILPEPKTPLQILVHQADYIASRKFFSFVED